LKKGVSKNSPQPTPAFQIYFSRQNLKIFIGHKKHSSSTNHPSEKKAVKTLKKADKKDEKKKVKDVVKLDKAVKHQ
jgi:hypothetical protein